MVRRGSVAPAAHHCPLRSDFWVTFAFFSPFFFLDLGQQSDSAKKLNPHPRYFASMRKKVLRLLGLNRFGSGDPEKKKKKEG